MLALGILIAYIGLIGLFAAHQRQNLVQLVQKIDDNQSRLSFLAPVFNALAHSLVDIETTLSSQGNADGHNQSYKQFADSLEPISIRLANVRQAYPILAPDIDKFEQMTIALREQSNARHLAVVRNSEQILVAKVQEMLTALQERNAELTESYHDTQQFINIISISANVAGAVISAVVILFFFSNLAKDIKRLQDRAIAVVAGYSGPPLKNTRRDEVGGLIDAVNRMQKELQHHEQLQEMSRQQRFHQEKMAAVGSLAAAVGHEVSNPMAAISGVAQYMMDETRDDNRQISKKFHEYASQILAQTERVSHIMRQMAVLTTPHTRDPELLDLNALVRATCSFISFDKRFRGIRLEENLDASIPAVTAVADHLTQIIMNLLINAADAMEAMPAEYKAAIYVTTRSVREAVELAVVDNGRGMSEDVLAKAFDESFTTKPAGKGRGIGLYLCKTLIEEGGGNILMESEPMKGTTVRLTIPLIQAANTDSQNWSLPA